MEDYCSYIEDVYLTFGGGWCKVFEIVEVRYV